MGLGQMRMYSRVLRRHVTFSFRLPDAVQVGPGPYPALLQLHGADDDHSAWIVNTKLAVHLDRTPLIVVMPEGARSQWLNRNPHERYEDFLMRDLLPACGTFFQVRPGRWAIGGLSMGGQGALYLGLKYPDRFASIYAHSSAVPDHETMHQWLPDLTPAQLDEADILGHAERCAARSDRPHLSFDCGVDDSLLEQNRAFHRHLDRIGYEHRYAEHSGGHSWEYWDDHVREAIAQHLDVLAG
jgi:putative tributyrin esterase